MKKLLVLFFIVFSMQVFFAHSPTDIVITYDNASDSLHVVVKHSITNSSIKDPTKHYIKTVELKINGKLFKTNTFMSQPTLDEQVTDFNMLPLNDNKNNKITIKATCNIIGSKTKNFTIKSMMKK